MNNNYIHLALCFDKRMLKYALVFLESLIKTNNNQKIYIHCFFQYNEMDEFGLFEKILKFSGFSYKFYEISKSQIKSLPKLIDSRFSNASFFRLFIPEMINCDIKKILYCDVDILIHGSILSLWNTDIDDYPLAAVYDTFRMKYCKNEIRKLYTRKDDKYFNSGVMLINIDYWRKNTLTLKMIKYIGMNKYRLELPDQDAINYYLSDKIKVLHPKWNYFYGLAVFKVENYNDLYSMKELKEARQNPVIIHFSYKRPDDEYCFHPYKNKYFEFLKESKYNHYFRNSTFLNKIICYLLSFSEPQNRDWILESDSHLFNKILRILLPEIFIEFLVNLKK